MNLSKISITGSLIFLFSQLFSSPSESLQRLLDGNMRYVENAPLHAAWGQEQREAVYEKQHPFAVIVGCADSRAAPEVIFDQGVGDLFVVRVAGNVIGPLGLDSIEYAAIYLGASVVLVMGHENCGAVDAVIAGTTKDIESVAKLIQPAVKEAKAEGTDDLLYRATVENAVRMKNYLLKTKVLKKMRKEGKIDVHAAYYNIQSGKIELVGEEVH